jgi:CHASE2 domain-containing sensor protein
MKAFISYLWDAIFCSLFVLVGMFLISLIPFDSDAFNPIQKAMADFQLSDIVFSKLRDNPDRDKNVVIVNIGNLDRRGIAKQIDIINQYKPKVIGIDARFFKAHPEDPEGDSALSLAFSKVENLVVGSKLIPHPYKAENDSIVEPHPKFKRYAHSGYVNIITKGEDEFKTNRDIVPQDHYYKWRVLDTLYKQEMIRDTTRLITSIKYLKTDTLVYSFPTKIAWFKDSNAVKKYLARNKDTEIINYQGNVDTRKTGTAVNAKIVFAVLDAQQVLDTAFYDYEVKDKVVLMGFLGEDISQNNWEDKFFTPLNENYIGKTYPDMYGVVSHANVISMILNGNFINEMPETLNTVLALILIFMNVLFINFLFHKLKVWYDGFSNIIVLVEAAILVWFVLYVFNNYNYKFDITLAIVALFLTGNFVELYHGIIKLGYEKLQTKVVALRKLKKADIKPL